MRGRTAGLISISGVCLSSFTLSLSVFISPSRLISLVSGYTLLMVDLDLDLGLTLFSELLLVLDPIINFSLGWVRSWGRLFCSSASEKKISSFKFMF